MHRKKKTKAQYSSKLNLKDRTPLQDVIPLATPYLLYVDPSSACNFRCRFCPTGHRDLVLNSDYRRSVMDLDLFRKMIEDLREFEQPLRVLRLNKIGEPLLNVHLPEMVRLAHASGCVQFVDLATNASMLTPATVDQLIDSGLGRINISLEGISQEQYRRYASVEIDFGKLVANLKYLYGNRGTCEVTIKIPANYLSEGDRKEFLSTFGDYCDRIFVEDLAPIWPGFDVEDRAGLKVTEEMGQYQQPLVHKDVCTYIFYSMAVNADGSVSACCPDWDQKLIVGDLRLILKSIWNSEPIVSLQRQHLEGRRCENEICQSCGHIKYAQMDNIDAHKEELLRALVSRTVARHD